MGLRVIDSFTVWRDDQHFTKNPDMVCLPSGKLLCVFNLTNSHWPHDYARITVIESEDGGRTWGNPQVIDESFPVKGEEPWVTPRISLLRDGRLIILCDQNDYRHCHESQPPGIYAWWSEDGGQTWSEQQPTGIPGIEPDRVRELPDGTLIVGSHYMFANTHKLGQVALHSFDGGKTWDSLSVVASDKVHNFCEGAMVPLSSGRIACIMRENNHNNYPSYISFSSDGGAMWSKPVEAPFSGDRPFAEQLVDGRVLVTYRNQAGRAGTFAWVGDIEQEHGYKVSVIDTGPAQGSALLKEGALMLDGERGVTRYGLLPPESEWSNVTLKATLCAQGEPNCMCGQIQIARIGVQLTIYPDGLNLESGNPELRHRADMTRWRDLTISYVDGKLEITLDGNVAIQYLIYRETLWARTFIGLPEGAQGSLSLKSISYAVQNPNESNHEWKWRASDGVYPNQYEIDRWVEIERNTNPRPDNGYSTWIRMPDGRFLILDYTNKEAPRGKAYLMGYVLELS